jgi:hypothetical protein
MSTSPNKKVYLITNGNRFFGANPIHTSPGIDQIKSLDIPVEITQVGIGTGLRFQEVYNIIRTKIPAKIPHFFSPFCGSADGFEADGQFILVDGTLVAQKNYLNLIQSRAFDAWEFISELANNTLLCSGDELMVALGLKSINQKGHLYVLDPEKCTGRMLQ